MEVIPIRSEPQIPTDSVDSAGKAIANHSVDYQMSHMPVTHTHTHPRTPALVFFLFKKKWLPHPKRKRVVKREKGVPDSHKRGGPTKKKKNKKMAVIMHFFGALRAISF
jgi:hypothetical protein